MLNAVYEQSHKRRGAPAIIFCKKVLFFFLRKRKINKIKRGIKKKKKLKINRKTKLETNIYFYNPLHYTPI